MTDQPIDLRVCDALDRLGMWTEHAGDWLKAVSLFDALHPAALGCLLQLVRDAWGDERDFRFGTGRRLLTKSRFASVEVWENGSRLHEFYGETEAEALVAALLAAPAHAEKAIDAFALRNAIAESFDVPRDWVMAIDTRPVSDGTMMLSARIRTEPAHAENSAVCTTGKLTS